MPCSRTQRSDGCEAQTLGLESITLPLSHCARLNVNDKVIEQLHKLVYICTDHINQKSLLSLLIAFANTLSPDNAQQHVMPYLDPKCLAILWYSKR